MYVAYTEGVNFKKSLADLLGLERGAGIGACLQRIRQLLDRSVAPRVTSTVQVQHMMGGRSGLNLYAVMVAACPCHWLIDCLAHGTTTPPLSVLA